MARAIFVDSGFWIALIHPPDQYHVQARAIWREVLIDRWSTATTNWTLYETITYFNCSVHRHDLAIQALEFVSRLSEIVRIEEAKLERRSLEIFRTHSDKRWSMVDCANFACIEQRQCEYALAFDNNFRQAQQEFRFQLFESQ